MKHTVCSRRTEAVVENQYSVQCTVSLYGHHAKFKNFFILVISVLCTACRYSNDCCSVEHDRFFDNAGDTDDSVVFLRCF